MEEVYVCSICEKQSAEEEEFQTSVDAEEEEGNMICEDCFDEMND